MSSPALAWADSSSSASSARDGLHALPAFRRSTSSTSGGGRISGVSRLSDLSASACRLEARTVDLSTNTIEEEDEGPPQPHPPGTEVPDQPAELEQLASASDEEELPAHVLEELQQYIPRQVLLGISGGVDLRWQSELREVTTVFFSLDSISTASDNVSGDHAAFLLQEVFTVIADESSHCGGEQRQAANLGKGTGSPSPKSASLVTLLLISWPHSKSLPGTLFKALAFDKGQTFLVAIGLPGQKQKDQHARALLLASRCHMRVQKVGAKPEKASRLFA